MIFYSHYSLDQSYVKELQSFIKKELHCSNVKLENINSPKITTCCKNKKTSQIESRKWDDLISLYIFALKGNKYNLPYETNHESIAFVVPLL